MINDLTNIRGITGVVQCWRAYITIKNKVTLLGTFDTKKEALAVYDKAEKEYYDKAVQYRL